MKSHDDHPDTVYGVIAAQRGTATIAFICGFLHRGVNDIAADLNFLSKMGHIKRDGSTWRAIRKPHTPPRCVEVMGVRL
jgi:hypothetical protein